MHVIAAKAVAFAEALQPAFKVYISNVINNAQVLGQTLHEQGLSIITGGTDSHLLLVDLTSLHITGKEAATLLEKAHITCNMNSIPFDPLPPAQTSGIRLGSPAVTTRGFTAKDCQAIGYMIGELLKSLAGRAKTLSASVEEIKAQAIALCKKYPLYPEL